MATIVTRSGKGSPLSHAEMDANFTNINTGIPTDISQLNDSTSLLGGGGGGGVTTHADNAALITAGASATNGDLAYVTGGAAIYLYNNGWYKIAGVNQSPVIGAPNADSVNLAVDGTVHTETITASDPENAATLTFSHAVSGATSAVTVSQGTGANINVFSITPSTDSANAGTASITYSVSDGVNTAQLSKSYLLEFPNIFTATTNLITNWNYGDDLNDLRNNDTTVYNSNANAFGYVLVDQESIYLSTNSWGVSSMTKIKYHTNSPSWHRFEQASSAMTTNNVGLRNGFYHNGYIIYNVYHGSNTGLVLYNVSSRTFGNYSTDTISRNTNMQILGVAGNFAFGLDVDGKPCSYDISNPTTPTQVAVGTAGGSADYTNSCGSPQFGQLGVTANGGTSGNYYMVQYFAAQNKWAIYSWECSATDGSITGNPNDSSGYSTYMWGEGTSYQNFTVGGTANSNANSYYAQFGHVLDFSTGRLYGFQSAYDNNQFIPWVCKTGDGTFLNPTPSAQNGKSLGTYHTLRSNAGYQNNNLHFASLADTQQNLGTRIAVSDNLGTWRVDCRLLKSSSKTQVVWRVLLGTYTNAGFSAGFDHQVQRLIVADLTNDNMWSDASSADANQVWDNNQSNSSGPHFYVSRLYSDAVDYRYQTATLITGHTDRVFMLERFGHHTGAHSIYKLH